MVSLPLYVFTSGLDVDAKRVKYFCDTKISQSPLSSFPRGINTKIYGPVFAYVCIRVHTALLFARILNFSIV